MRLRSRKLAALAALATAAVLGTTAVPAQAEDPVVLASGFETGTTEGSRRATVSASTAQAATGQYSLLTTGRTAGWNGPAYDILDVLQA